MSASATPSYSTRATASATGRPDPTISPLWAGQPGGEPVVELEAYWSVKKERVRQAQVYILLPNIDEGAALSFASEVLVAEARRPVSSRWPVPNVPPSV
jgi:hypothetical protein